jgi:predicted AAA+ superfamily ATPase
MILKETLLGVLRSAVHPPTPRVEVVRELLQSIGASGPEAVILKGVRRSGKSTLMRQQMRQLERTIACNFEDTRLYGFGGEDFARFVECVGELLDGAGHLFLDEVQEVEGWERLVRALLDRGHKVWATGSNASLLSREVGGKLTGRHRSFEVFPFDYREYLRFRQLEAGADSLAAYMDQGGFPGFLEHGEPIRLQELLRDIVQRDIALRHGLRETRHLMNLTLFLIAHSGQPFSQQKLSRILQIPSVSQVGNYLEYLEDAYLLFGLPKRSYSFKQRIITPKKYYLVDNGLARVNTPQLTPDRGRRLENQVFLTLRQHRNDLAYDAETDLWECDFVYDDKAIQVCWELNETNFGRETEGLLQAASRAGSNIHDCRILTFNQADQLTIDTLPIKVQPVWEWLQEQHAATIDARQLPYFPRH